MQKRNKPQAARVRAALGASVRPIKACAGFCVLAAAILFCIKAYAQLIQQAKCNGEFSQDSRDIHFYFRLQNFPGEYIAILFAGIAWW
jgi:hypothetical protein